MNSIFQNIKDTVGLVSNPQRLKAVFADISHKTWIEISETSDMLHVLWRLSKGESVTDQEKEQALDQAKDLAKTVPAFGIFMLPGGMLLLPLLAKIVPWDILPSAFQNAKNHSKSPEDIAKPPKSNP